MSKKKKEKLPPLPEKPWHGVAFDGGHALVGKAGTTREQCEEYERLLREHIAAEPMPDATQLAESRRLVEQYKKEYAEKKRNRLEQQQKQKEEGGDHEVQ